MVLRGASHPGGDAGDETGCGAALASTATVQQRERTVSATFATMDAPGCACFVERDAGRRLSCEHVGDQQQEDAPQPHRG